jgi:hypothetical protein
MGSGPMPPTVPMPNGLRCAVGLPGGTGGTARKNVARFRQLLSVAVRGAWLIAQTEEGPPGAPAVLQSLQQFHINGRFRTSAPGAYLPAASYSGTPAHRRTFARGPPNRLMAMPSLQAKQQYPSAIRDTQQRSSRCPHCSTFPQDGTKRGALRCT